MYSTAAVVQYVVQRTHKQGKQATLLLLLFIIVSKIAKHSRSNKQSRLAKKPVAFTAPLN